MIIKKILFIVTGVALLAGCSAKEASLGAEQVSIVSEKPTKCKFLGEVAGAQGNWLTGGYTSDKDLMVGARNDLRNATYKKGGDTVFMQSMNNSGRFIGSGTSSSTIIGYAYKCR